MTKGHFSKKIAEWYREYHRDLPWRNTPDPYKIWVSEIILQQTRVIQGLPYYLRFIRNYPNIKSLARAKEQDILRLWQGLGYYTRARNLRKCAREVVSKFDGKFPQSFEALRKLPGIGDYTAAAIASFAFHQPVAVIDGNVYRVLSRVFGISHDVGSSQGRKVFSKLANELIPGDSPGQHNQAIMEFGALHCVPKSPKCEECPLMRNCFAFQHDHQDLLPVKTKRQKIVKRHFTYWVIRKGKKILMKQRIEKDIWKGLFDFPLDEEISALTQRDIAQEKFLRKRGLQDSRIIIRTSQEYRHVLTHRIILARFLAIEWPVDLEPPTTPLFSGSRWFSLTQIENLPKPILITRFLAESEIL